MLAKGAHRLKKSLARVQGPQNRSRNNRHPLNASLTRVERSFDLRCRGVPYDFSQTANEKIPAQPGCANTSSLLYTQVKTYSLFATVGLLQFRPDTTRYKRYKKMSTSDLLPLFQQQWLDNIIEKVLIMRNLQGHGLNNFIST